MKIETHHAFVLTYRVRWLNCALLTFMTSQSLLQKFRENRAKNKTKKDTLILLWLQYQHSAHWSSTLNFNFDMKLGYIFILNEVENLKTKAYILQTGNELNSPGTEPWGNIVCLLGLLIPQANLANIWKKTEVLSIITQDHSIWHIKHTKLRKTCKRSNKIKEIFNFTMK